MGMRAQHPIELLGYELDRCPLAMLRDRPIDSQMETDQIIRLAVSKRNGNLSPYPGAYSVRALSLIDLAESEIIKLQAEQAEDARKESERRASTKNRVRRG